MENGHRDDGQVLSFGPFTLDPGQERLLRGQDKVPLKPQPFKLLHMLASRDGGVVNREEIKEALWPGDTFVDYDTGINSCIRQVRRALGDDRETPRYVETVPRKGYRFIAGVAGATSKSPVYRLVAAGAVIPVLVWAMWDVTRFNAVDIRFTNPVRLTSAEGVESYPAWSPDGTLLAYTVQSDALVVANTDVWVVPVAGGDALNRTSDYLGINNFPSWRPSGSELTFRSDREGPGIYATSALAGPVRKLFDVGEVRIRTAPASWSKDGKQAAVSSADEDGPYVEIVSPETGDARQVPLPTAGYYFDLTWSPNEKFLAYVQTNNRRSDSTSLWIVREVDGESFRVTESETAEWSPTWSPDSRTLYFVSNAGGTMDLWQQRLEGDGVLVGEPEAITSGMEIRRAAISPDGDRVALVRGSWVSNLWKAPIFSDRPATWADARQITFDRDFIRRVAVTDDGERIAVISNRRGGTNIWLVGEGGELEPLLEGSVTGSTLDWSADGGSLLLTGGDDKDLWVVPADGGTYSAVTQHEGFESWGRWSADEARVVFLSSRSGDAEIWIRSMDGSESRQVSEKLDYEVFVKPDWTPDGKSVSTVIYRPSTGARLVTMPVDGGDSIEISDDPIWNYLWADTGDIYFTALSPPLAGNVWALSPDGAEKRALTDFTGKSGTLGADAMATDGHYLYFTWEEDVGDLWIMDVETP